MQEYRINKDILEKFNFLKTRYRKNDTFVPLWKTNHDCNFEIFYNDKYLE